jgi:O-antigen/teichoic acid export membrane protein
MRRSLAFFALKSANTALATGWSFLLAYCLVRLMGLQDYAFFATLLAVAALVLQADLGISIRLFGQLRQQFLAPAAAPEGAAAGQGALEDAMLAALLAYGGAALLATAAFAAALWGIGLGNPDWRLAYLLIFLGAVLPLPWMVLRVAVNARDGFVLSEGIDFLRRALLMALTVGLLFGLPLDLYAACFVLLGLGGLAALALLARRHGYLARLRPRRGFAALRADLPAVSASALLSIAEFLIYIFPYYAIPLLHGGAAALVAFDMFYKVTRFGTTAYLTVAETLLPRQTRAFHAGDAAALRRLLAIAGALGALPLLGGLVVVVGFGERFFALLLNHPGIVSPGMRLAIGAMLAAMLVQTVCGALLAAVGWLAPLARRAGAVFLAMLAFTAVAAALRLPLEGFMAGYVALYALEALSYLLLCGRLLRQMR